jgi:hypothetical protein
MSEQGDLTEKYILLAGASFGLRAIDFMAITFGDYRACHLEEDAPVSLGTRNTIKENVRANPFLSSDAVTVVKAILEKYPNAKDTDRVLDFSDEQVLTLSLKRMFNNAHLVAGPRIVRFHALRAYLIDRLSAICSESQWKQIVGKKISEGAYISTDQLREIYARAMPSIIINGNQNHAKIEQLEFALQEQQKSLAAKDTIIQTLEKKLGYVTTETANNSTTISDLLRRLEKLESKKDDTDKKDDTKTT